jgi:hypothetical protein
MSLVPVPVFGEVGLCRRAPAEWRGAVLKSNAKPDSRVDRKVKAAGTGRKGRRGLGLLLLPVLLIALSVSCPHGAVAQGVPTLEDIISAPPGGKGFEDHEVRLVQCVPGQTAWDCEIVVRGKYPGQNPNWIPMRVCMIYRDGRWDTWCVN